MRDSSTLTLGGDGFQALSAVPGPQVCMIEADRAADVIMARCTSNAATEWKCRLHFEQRLVRVTAAVLSVIVGLLGRACRPRARLGEIGGDGLAGVPT